MKTIIVLGVILLTFFLKTSGQIIYTEIGSPDTLTLKNGYYPAKMITVDFNNDSIIDVAVAYTLSKGSGCSPLQYAVVFRAVNYLKIFNPNSWGKPAIFNNGDTIKNDAFYQEQQCSNNDMPCMGIESFNIYFCERWDSIVYFDLNDYVNNYYGFKFLINNEYHYAWIKFSRYKGGTIWFESYAYDTMVNEYLVIEDLNATEIKSSYFGNLITYPNPVNENLNIYFDNQQTGIIKVTNITGQILLTKNIENVQSVIINLEHLKSGIYLVLFETKAQIIVRKIVKN